MSLKHKRFMEIAIQEARKCKGEDEKVHPMVGAVVVKEGKVLATGYRGELSPGEHAEFTVLEKKLGEAVLAGSTLYTTLEPCTTRNHPKVPCAERLIERKISKVVIGMLDPDLRISGKGQRRLREANIITELFPSDLMSIVEEINRFFIREKKKEGLENQFIINDHANLKRPEDVGIKTDFAEPLIKCLLPIQDALAAQPDKERRMPIFWSDLDRVYRRKECDELLRLLEKSNIVLIEGYPASGKSCIVYKLISSLNKQGTQVYYGNLTTRIGLVYTTPQELPNRLMIEARNVSQETFIIIEDIHHSPSDFEQLNFLTNNPKIKLVFTARPLKDYFIEKDIGDKTEKETLLFRWIESGNRLVLQTDESVVKEILAYGGFSYRNPQKIINLVGSKRPNLLLLSFVMQASISKKKAVDEITDDDVSWFVQDHLKALARRVCGSKVDETYYWRLIGAISSLSQFEVPVEESFLSRACPDDYQRTRILQHLEKEKEIIFFERVKPDYKKYCLIPHSRLAFAFQNVCVEARRLLGILKDYILTGEFFGTLSRRLFSENEIIMRYLVNNFAERLVQKDLTYGTPKEIGDYLWTISQVNKSLAKDIVFTHAQTLTTKDFSYANLMEIGDYLWMISQANEGLAKDIVFTHVQTLTRKDLSHASLDQISKYLSEISWRDAELAQTITSAYDQILKIKLSSAGLNAIEDFLSEISWRDERLANEIVSSHTQTLKNKLSQGTLREVWNFLWEVCSRSKGLTKSITSIYGEIVNTQDLSQETLSETRDFLSAISRIDKRLAKDFVSAHTQALNNKLSQGGLKEIADFLWEISRADKSIAKDITSAHTQALNNKLSQGELKEIADFIWEISSGDKELAKNIVSAHSEALRNHDLSQASLEDIFNFLHRISELKNDVVSDIASTQAQTLDAKLSSAGDEARENFFHLINNISKELVSKL